MATTTSIPVGQNPNGETTALATVTARIIELLQEVERAREPVYVRLAAASSALTVASATKCAPRSAAHPAAPPGAAPRGTASARLPPSGAPPGHPGARTPHERARPRSRRQ